MGVRYYADHITDTGVRVRVDIHDSLFGGASAKLKGTGSDWLSYTHQLLEPSQYEEIQKGEVSCGVFVQNSAHETFRNDIISSSEGRFEIYLYFDGVFEWKGTVLPDLCTYSEDTPESFYITAKDFTLLKRDLFPISGTREIIISTIEDILSTYSLPIITATSWTESNTPLGNDFLRQIFHSQEALREFADDDDVQITNDQALRWILRSYGMTLKQSGGALRIDQFTAYDDPTAVLLSTYNSGFQSQASTNVTQTAKVTIESDNKPNAGIKRVKNKFAHRTQQSVFLSPTAFPLTTGGTRTFTFNVSGGGVPIKLEGFISALGTTSKTLSSYGSVPVRISVGQYSWKNGQWSVLDGNNRYTIVDLVREEGPPPVGETEYNFTGNISIITTLIPSDAEAGLEIEFQSATLGSAGNSIDASNTNYSNLVLEVDFEEGNSSAIEYELVNADSYTEEINYPTTYFGDGPNENSPSALRYSIFTSEITGGGWRRRGDAITARSLHGNLLHEILDPRRAPRRVLNGVIKSTFEPHKVLVYDSTNFYYLGGTFDGYTGNWSIQAVEISITDNEEAIAVLLTQRLQSLFTGTGSTINLTTRDIRKLLGITNTIGVTTVDYDNVSTTTLAVELNVPMRSGIEYWVVNIDQLDWRDLTKGIYSVIPEPGVGGAVKDYGTGVVDIDEQIIDAPAGSIMVKAPAQTEIDNNLQEERDEDFDTRIDGLDGNFTELQTELDAVLPITETKISDGAISTPKLQANSVLTGNLGAGAVTAIKIDVADLAASSAFIEELMAKELVIRSGGFIQGEKFRFDHIGGNIAGWLIDTNTLKSQASGVRIELNKAQNRISIFDAIGEKAVMGYLNGLPKNKDPLASWGVADYGFWAKDGDNLVIDGDVEYDAGDWIVKNDGSYLVQDSGGNTIIRLGTDTGDKGLFLYNATGTNLAKFITNEVFIGAGAQSLKYTVAGGLEISGKITVSSGSNVYDKTEIDTLEGEIIDDSDIIAARRTVEVVDKQITPAYDKLMLNTDLVDPAKNALTTAYNDYVTKRNTFMDYTAGTHIYSTANTYYTNLKNAVGVFIDRYEDAIDSISGKRATDAENNAKGFTNTELDTAAQKLGYVDYATMKASAALGETLIDGGFIRTSLIVADAVLAADILSKNVGISGTLTMATGGSIRNAGNDFRISTNGIQIKTGGGSTQSIRFQKDDGSGGFGTLEGRIFSLTDDLQVEASIGTLNLSGNNIGLNTSGVIDIGGVSTLNIFMGTKVTLWNRTTTQMNAISSPPTGATIFNTTVNSVAFYNGSAWRQVNNSAF